MATDAPSPYPGRCPGAQAEDLKTADAGDVNVALIPTFQGNPDMDTVAHPNYNVPFDTKRALLVLTTNKTGYHFSAQDVSDVTVLAQKIEDVDSGQSNACSTVKTMVSFIGTVPGDAVHDPAGLWEVRAVGKPLYKPSASRLVRLKVLQTYTNRAADFYYAATVAKVGDDRVQNTAGFRLLDYYYAHR
ncbi:hypothetical protein [Brevibacterium sp. 91QC2O2]|uniref:hypothetical protein n=2 Tax=unclassified Brevibacterium TaxID=2614124 RepID=UPI00211CCC33|nr:hypothetical protein [Brevibacterium sp. 91QC2O2]